MVTLAILIVVVLLMSIGIVARRRSGRSLDSAFTSALAIQSAGTGIALVGGGLLAYVIVMRAVQGGSIASNLPPGLSEGELLNLGIIGAILVILRAIHGYLDNLRS